MVVLKFVGGLICLVVGAEGLVRGASQLAVRMGVPSLIIGLTVVAYGTSAPEFAVSIQSALAGEAAVAIGNVVGSNSFNILFILGISALIVPLAVSSQLVRLDVPLMIAVSGVVWFFSLDGRLSRTEGALLFGGTIAYTLLLAFLAKRVSLSDSPAETSAAVLLPWPRAALWIAGGLALLILGSSWLVESSIVFAQAMGVSELVIGLTIVAAGTSMPEVVTSIVASVRGERDIAVGNVVGSNLFNLLGVLGAAALVASDGLEVHPAVLRFDMPVMTAVAVACLPIFFTGMRIARWEGAILLFYYAAYAAYLVMQATQHDALPGYSLAMRWFALPITGLTLLVTVGQALKRRRNDAHRTRRA